MSKCDVKSISRTITFIFFFLFRDCFSQLSASIIYLFIVFFFFMVCCQCFVHSFVGFDCRYVLESPNVKKFFDYIQLPYFDISADAAATFKVKHD
jgi:hypothetical protein